MEVSVGQVERVQTTQAGRGCVVAANLYLALVYYAQCVRSNHLSILGAILMVSAITQQSRATIRAREQ